MFWIDASSTDTIIQGLKGICNIPEAQSSALDGSPKSALLWISTLGDNYAMVFDNADNLTPEELEQYFPSGLGGNILITSRNSGLRHLTLHENSLEVKEMEEKDVISLLLKAACLDESQEDSQAEASKIVNEVFCIPLAIDQAGAFIAFGDTDITDYLEEYSQHREKLLNYPAFKGASTYNRTVYQTWELSHKEIQQRAEGDNSQRAEAASSAMLLMAMFSFFHFDGISEEIFSYAATLEHEKNGDNEQISALPLATSILDHTLLELDEAGKWDNFIFKEGLRVLFSFSLIKWGSLKGVYAVHPLIHMWGRDRMSLEDKHKYSLMAYGMLAGCLLKNFDEQPYQFRRTLVTHLRANIQHSVMPKKKMVDRYFDDAYEKFGRLLKEQGYDSEAEKLQIQVLDARSRTLGEEHESTISAMSNLASTYGGLGKYADAEKLKIKILDLRNKYLGKEHPCTISAMSNLGITYSRLGKYADAEKLQIKVLDLKPKFLEEEHPDTITAMITLAAIRENLRKCADAEKQKIKALDLSHRILGEEHPDGNAAMSNLAVISDKLADAENLQIKFLDLKKKLFRKEQYITAMAMNNLANTYYNLGKYADAEKLQIKVLDLENRLFGQEDPKTMAIMGNLASTYMSLGNYIDGEKLQIKVLDLRNKYFGAEHPETMLAMDRLSSIYHIVGKHADAEKLQIKVLDLETRLFGQEHPNTISTMGSLSITYWSLGKYADAEKLQTLALDLRNKSFGEEYPDTIFAMHNLATTYNSLEKYADAEKLHIKALDLGKRLLGEEHPDTISAMEGLAITLCFLQRYTDAARLQVQVVDVRKKIFGMEHVQTVKAAAILVEIRSQLNLYASGIESKK